MPYDVLKQRLQQRLDQRGVAITEVIHEEFCLFPMNLPLPDRSQPLLAFGGAASMVHPASGYMVGSLLRRGPGLAQAIAEALATPSLASAALAQRGWQALWPMELVLRHQLYQFGFGAVDGLQRSVVAHPLRHLLFAAAGGVVWLPHQHTAVAQVDRGDAALVCSVPLLSLIHI